MNINNLIKLILFTLCAVMLSCTSDTNQNSESPKSGASVFSLLSSKTTGVDFNNEISETKQINYFVYNYLYNGGGVGIGDINNDGLADIYFTSTLGVDKLYLNKGGFEFEDISEKAGINKYNGVKTGVTFVDINSDGWMDIYVCRAGWEENRKNLLFINRKDNTFVEAAGSYGLNSNSRSIQSIFFDYDKDGDLDMYLANHPKKFAQASNEMFAAVKNPVKADSDILFRNDGNGKFSDVSKQAGILNFAYSLGVAAGDFNGDSWTDLYVTSDFQPRDLYYINNGDGTFKESLRERFPHCSYFSMGLDMVDINDDGHLDIFTAEMLAEENVRQKTQMASMDTELFASLVKNDMHYQYMRNSFHVNNGNGYFSDIAHYSGIDKSDWSWSSLFGDYDHDGDNDLLVANGWLRDTQDKDFTIAAGKMGKQYNNKLTFAMTYSLLKSTPIKNYAFENDGKLKFSNASKKWGFDFKGFSNGMAYGDLDNDGDLDLVVNNINSEASIYKNNSNGNNYLKVKLKGPAGNPNGLNSKLKLITDKGVQYKEFQVTRGFQSSCQPEVHFGYKEGTSLKSLEVTWPNGNKEIINSFPENVLTVDFRNSKTGGSTTQQNKPLFANVTSESKVDFNHQEAYFDDYKVQVLLPHQLSKLGPALCSGDVNSDGLEDFYIGGAHRQSGKLYIQLKNGSFEEKAVNALINDKKYEDVDASFVDMNEDGHLDLYVVSGSYEFHYNQDNLTDRLYINNGKGEFKRNLNLLPKVKTSGGCVAHTDINGDGKMDLFIGGRVDPGNYPISPKSVLLVSSEKGYKNEIINLAPELEECGMICSAVWEDYDKDGDDDLIVAGEWTNPMFYKNEGGKLSKQSSILSKDEIGWWNCIVAADLDNDDDLDFVLGNLGENYKYKASDDEPFEIYASDLDENGRSDIVLGYYLNKTLYPVRGFQCSSEQLPQLSQKFETYEDFGKSDVFQVYGDALKEGINIKANNFSSSILWNEGGSFELQKLPYKAQLSPIKDIVVHDLNKDGFLDILTAGNWFVSEVETPRADNGTGLVMFNNKNKGFEALSVDQSGFFANGDVRNLIKVNDDDKLKIVVANNNSKAQVFALE